MIALKVTTTMASPSISTLKQPTWVRTLSSSSPSSSSLITNPATTFKHRRISPLMSTTPNSNSNSLLNRKNGAVGGGGGGERLLRLISCADIGWGGVHDNNNNKTSIIPPKIKKSFSSSASAAANNNPQITKNNMKDGGGDGGGGGDEESAPKLLTIPTILTLGRVAAIPLLITTFYSNFWWATTATTSIFIAAAITDWLDGYIARKMHLGTPFGAFLDPVADKLMVAATLVLLCTKPLEVGSFGEIPWLLPIPSIAIIGREITMSAVREWAASQNGKVLEAVAVNNLGKWKTASQMVSLTILLATRDTSILGSNILVPTGVSLLYISAGLAVWSLAVYMKKIWRVMLKL